MFTEKDLIVGATVLVRKIDNRRALYLGNVGLVHFVSNTIDFECANNNNFTIQELNEWYIIEQPKSKVVPLEKKVYDFVPVRCRDNDNDVWKDFRLVAVVGNKINRYPYTVIDEEENSFVFRYCEFLNEQ